MNLNTFVSDTTDPRQRGREIGACWTSQIQRTVGSYLAFFPQLDIQPSAVRLAADASLQALRDWCPALAEEVEGLAEGARLPLWQLAALNARTEILALAPRAPVEGECSTAVYAPAGADRVLSLQTWDWHDSLVPEGLLLQLVGSHGLTVKLFTEFGMLGKIGVNSAGVGVHFNILHHASDHGDAGVPVHAVARRVIEEARSVDEAVALVRSARVSASTVLTVFSHQAAPLRLASIEMSPAAVAVVEPEAGWMLHTNHFLDAGLAHGERTQDVSTTYARLAHVYAQRSAMAGTDLRARARAMCGSLGAQAPICFHADPELPPTERWETLLTVALNTERCELEYHAGNPLALAELGFFRF
ncbi:C45 family peptidase [Pseudomonas entomophila]|uniref:C45 family autoproteolytic acyltransferase/hydolase n=1 Tax=Pseudomonas sp. RIT-PI-S TaxID=3035295 RepID=UPI0021DA9051